MKTVERKLNPGIIYGPVNSRRFGVSLGINISGHGKYCSFNCPYCFRGANQGRPNSDSFKGALPSCKTVLESVKAFLNEADFESIEDWTIAGNAEPTDNPQFPGIVDGLVELRNRICPSVKLTVLTNGMGLIPRLNPHYQRVVEALNKTDRACLKLDSGLPATWKQLARPYPKIGLEEWLDAACGIVNPIVQTMLVKGRIDNHREEELQALHDCWRRLQAREVQLLTLDKQPLDSRLLPLTAEELSQIRSRFTECHAAP